MGFNKYYFIKKNKNTSYIQDGIVKYTIFLKGFPKCICMKDNNLCKHINYYFSDIIGLEQWKINMLEIPEVKEKVIEKGIEYKYITDICLEYLEDNDCGICLENLIKGELYRCEFCKKMIHYKCFKDWNKRNNKKNCIYCNQEVSLF